MSIPFERGRRFPLVQGGACDAALRASIAQDASLNAGVRAGLLLYAGYWEESHSVAQDLHTPEGSYWHAILHRIEPDAWNSGYWFRRVGKHPVYAQVREAAAALGYPVGRDWDPIAFVEYCGRAASKPGSAEEKLALDVQYAEWEALMAWCEALAVA